MTISYNKEEGLRAENFFLETIQKKNIPVEYIDGWYDFLLYGKIKVEVKSTQISVKSNKKEDEHSKYSIGRFDFTNQESREKQHEENVWVCLIVRHYNQFIIYGFLQSNSIKDKRYLTLHEARELKPFQLDNFLDNIREDE